LYNPTSAILANSLFCLLFTGAKSSYADGELLILSFSCILLFFSFLNMTEALSFINREKTYNLDVHNLTSDRAEKTPKTKEQNAHMAARQKALGTSGGQSPHQAPLNHPHFQAHQPQAKDTNKHNSIM
jgi:hypothetical protein